jgi:predicted DNA-binding protein
MYNDVWRKEAGMLEVNVGFRLSPEEVQRLDNLARQVGRKRSELLRLLIGMAEATGVPDMVLTPPALAGKDDG